jgi:hypothetical protein
MCLLFLSFRNIEERNGRGQGAATGGAQNVPDGRELPDHQPNVRFPCFHHVRLCGRMCGVRAIVSERLLPTVPYGRSHFSLPLM